VQGLGGGSSSNINHRKSFEAQVLNLITETLHF